MSGDPAPSPEQLGKGDGVSSDALLELERTKLVLEIDELRAAARTRWTSTYWPVFSAIVAALAGLVAAVLSSQWQRAQERQASLHTSLDWATDSENPFRRTAGATALGLRGELAKTT